MNRCMSYMYILLYAHVHKDLRRVVNNNKEIRAELQNLHFPSWDKIPISNLSHLGCTFDTEFIHSVFQKFKKNYF